MLPVVCPSSPKGVVNGNYRCSYLGFDLNRHWLTPSAWAQPEILSVKTLVTRLHEDPSVDLDFYVGELGGSRRLVLSITCRTGLVLHRGTI